MKKNLLKLLGIPLLALNLNVGSARADNHDTHKQYKNSKPYPHVLIATSCALYSLFRREVLKQRKSENQGNYS
jgi:hypothetical protein